MSREKPPHLGELLEMPEVQGDGHPVPTSSFLLFTCISFLGKYFSNYFYFFFFAENKGSLQDMQVCFETADFFFTSKKIYPKISNWFCLNNSDLSPSSHRKHNSMCSSMGLTMSSVFYIPWKTVYLSKRCMSSSLEKSQLHPFGHQTTASNTTCMNQQTGGWAVTPLECCRKNIFCHSLLHHMWP